MMVTHMLTLVADLAAVHHMMALVVRQYQGKVIAEAMDITLFHGAALAAVVLVLLAQMPILQALEMVASVLLLL